MILSLETLRAIPNEPQYFGLGFIQLKIDDFTRLHFYHPDLEAIVPEEELHDHRYNFRSEILIGKLVHETFEFVINPEGSHLKSHVSCIPGKTIENLPEPVRGHIVRTGRYEMAAGSAYDLTRTVFHRVSTNTPTVTYLSRGPADDRVETATVLREIGRGEVCAFSKKLDQETVWAWIGKIIGHKAAGYHIGNIPKGKFGEPSKIVEEALEFQDAIAQRVDVMALVELSDLQGAIRAYLAKYHPSVTIDSLIKMSDVTERAFKNGYR